MARLSFSRIVAHVAMALCAVAGNGSVCLFAQTAPDVVPAPANDLPDIAAGYLKQGDYARAELLLRSSLEARLAGLDAAAAGQSEHQQLAAMLQARTALSGYLNL